MNARQEAWEAAAPLRAGLFSRNPPNNQPSTFKDGMDGCELSDTGDTRLGALSKRRSSEIPDSITQTMRTEVDNVKDSVVAPATYYSYSKLDWSNLCVEVLSMCMEYLDLDTLYLKARQTCRHWRQVGTPLVRPCVVRYLTSPQLRRYFSTLNASVMENQYVAQSWLRHCWENLKIDCKPGAPGSGLRYVITLQHDLPHKIPAIWDRAKGILKLEPPQDVMFGVLKMEPPRNQWYLTKAEMSSRLVLTFVRKSFEQIEVPWTEAQNSSREGVGIEFVGEVMTLKKANWLGGIEKMPLYFFEMEQDVLPRFKVKRMLRRGYCLMESVEIDVKLPSPYLSPEAGW
jgi:F-box domain